MQLMTSDNIETLRVLFEQNWSKAAEEWESKGDITLFEEVPSVLFRSICTWTGVPFEEEDVKERANDLIAMVDGFGAFGPRHQRGKRARERSERWLKGIVGQVRSKELIPSKGSPLQFFSNFKDANGTPLSDLLTAIELLNLLRPTVAISYYIVFGAVALHQHPAYAEEIKQGNEEFIDRFCWREGKKGFSMERIFFPERSTNATGHLWDQS